MYLEENVICGAHVHIRLHKHTYGFPMHPDNLILSVAARFDILSHSTQLSLHGTCLNLFPVWFTFQLSPNLNSSLNKLEDPPNLPNLGVGSKPSKTLEIKRVQMPGQAKRTA